MLKQDKKCRIIPPDWMAIDSLQQPFWHNLDEKKVLQYEKSIFRYAQRILSIMPDESYYSFVARQHKALHNDTKFQKVRMLNTDP